ncbi:ABC transporter permease [Acidisoma sp. 7E03]
MSRLLHRHPWIVTLVSIMAVLGAWVGATYGGLVSDLLLPTPDELWDGATDLALNGYKGYSLGAHIGLSLLRVGLGFGFGTIVGTLLGLAMGMSEVVDALAAPFIEFLRPLPQLAYLVLLIIWFGIGETPKIVLLFLAALPVSAVAARDGVRNVSAERVRAAQSLGASRAQIFFHVVLPSALGEIFVGARLSVGIVYATLIAAEMIAGASGIGWLILDAGRFLRSDYVLAGVLLIAVMGILLDRGLLLVQRRIVHWAGK